MHTGTWMTTLDQNSTKLVLNKYVSKKFFLENINLVISSRDGKGPRSFVNILFTNVGQIFYFLPQYLIKYCKNTIKILIWWKTQKVSQSYDLFLSMYSNATCYQRSKLDNLWLNLYVTS